MLRTIFLFLLTGNLSCATIVNEDDKMHRTDLPDINKLWDYSKPAETRIRFEKLFNDQKENAPLDYLLQIETQIARTYSLVANFEKAHEILDAIEKRLSRETPIAKVRYLLERGRTYNSSGEKESASRIFEEAYNYGREIQAFTYSVDAAHMLGISSPDLESKLLWNEKGLAEAQKSDDPSVRKWIGVFFNNMGWDLFNAKQFENALEQFEKSRDFYREANQIDRLRIARWSIAKTYRFLGRVDEALLIQTTLLEENGGVDKSGYTYEELAEIYLIKKDEAKSRDYFKKSYEILSKDIWLQKNEPERLARMKRLASD